MKRLVAAGGFLVLAATAFAQSTQDQTVLVPASKDVNLRRIYTSPDDFRPYRGAYSLSNGKTLVLSRQGQRMYAQVDQQSQHEIIRASEGNFLALDGKMSMLLDVSGNDANGELTYVDEARSTADVQQRPVTIRLAGH